MQRNYRNVILSFVGVALLSTVFILSSPAVNSTSASDKRFNVAMRTVLRHEGGLTNSKNDKGGITNYGISLRFLKAEHIDPNADGLIDSDDIIHLTKKEADKIYYKEFFTRNHYDKILSQTITTKVLDFAINAGASQANKLIKRSINRISSEPVKVDGIMDEATIDIINFIEPSVLYSTLIAEEEDFYKTIVKRSPSLKVFEKGWLARCRDK